MPLVPADLTAAKAVLSTCHKHAHARPDLATHLTRPMPSGSALQIVALDYLLMATMTKAI